MSLVGLRILPLPLGHLRSAERKLQISAGVGKLGQPAAATATLLYFEKGCRKTAAAATAAAAVVVLQMVARLHRDRCI